MFGLRRAVDAGVSVPVRPIGVIMSHDAADGDQIFERQPFVRSTASKRQMLFEHPLT
jgi:hypothetical protein